jgi:uncharacterized linocin/CFP29 family protein
MGKHFNPDAALIGGDFPFPPGPDGRPSVLAARPFIDDAGDARIVVNSEGETQLVANDGAALPYQAWLDIETAIYPAARLRMVGIGHLQGRGLIYPVPSLGHTVTLWNVSSDMTPADINMSGITPGEEDRVRYDTRQVPIPIVHKDFRINYRNMEAMRAFGARIDVTDAEIAAQRVAERSEEMLFSGTPIKVEGGEIFGYRNFPARTQIDLTTDWLSADPEQIRDDVQAMLAAARAKRYYGPFMLYIPAEYEGVLDEYFLIGDPENGPVAPTQTVRAAIMSLAGIEGIAVSDWLGASNEVLLVQLTRDVVDLAVAQDITTISWQTMGGMVNHYKVMAAWAPRVKSDYDGRCGIVHLRPQ